MAQYKVPQDVEADDKLLGPFTFRQFVYLLAAGALIAIAAGLFQIHPLLIIIPLPVIILLLVISLPLKKDQPMETYLAALVSYYLKPRKRTWTSGQPESTITITAPKVQEKVRTRDISGEEVPDIFEDSSQYRNIDAALEKDKTSRHAEAMENMRKAIAANEAPLQPQQAPTISRHYDTEPQAFNPARAAAPSVPTAPGQPAPMQQPAPAPVQQPAPMQQPAPNPAFDAPNYNSPVVVLPDPSMFKKEEPKASVRTENVPSKPQKQDIINLASNQDFTVSTIAQEAKRIKGKGDSEVFISLH